MRLLWLLPKLAPPLLRHVFAYIDLAGQELEHTQRNFAARMLAGAVVGFCVFFVILSGCLLVLAMTWDTPYRVAAVAWMGGVFLLVAVVAAAYRVQVVNRQGPFFDAMRREWQEDRMILERLLSTHED